MNTIQTTFILFTLLITVTLSYTALEEDGTLLSDAQFVLELNWIGRSTLPAPKLYPHQWSWDSAFISIGKSHYDQEQAQTELITLFQSQWKNGMVPHIVFNPDVPDYFPGFQWWDVKNASVNAPSGSYTSGIIQPPVHAIAALTVYKNAKDVASAKQFLSDMYQKLSQWHDYLYKERSWKENLIYLRHPWESGMDNSPLWDQALHNIDIKPGMIPEYNRSDDKLVNNTDRPTKWTYDRFVWLVELSKSLNYNEVAIREIALNNFLIVDVLFNSILVQANRDLAEIAMIMGDHLGNIKYINLAEKTASALMTHLWNDTASTFLNFDMITDEYVPIENSMVAASFAPLFAEVVPRGEKLDRMFSIINSDEFCSASEITDGKCWPVPSFSRAAQNFSTHNYWRGPNWINIDWILYKGLQKYADHSLEIKQYANLLKENVLKLVSTVGFFEYFNPLGSSGHGTDQFSWTAALVIDLLFEK